MNKLEILVGNENCSTHGRYSFNAYRLGKMILGRVCPKCLEEGQLKAQEKNSRRLAQNAIRFQEEQISLAMIPEAFKDCTFENYDILNIKSKKTVEVLHKYIKNFKTIVGSKKPPGLIFSGVPQTGKTHLGCATIKRLIAAGHSALYCSAPIALLEMDQARFGRHDLSATALLHMYSSTSFLMIDDFGAHTTRDSDYQALFSVIDQRFQKNLPTLITTNLKVSSGSVQKVIDDRMIERVRGEGGALLSFDWPSYRANASLTV